MKHVIVPIDFSDLSLRGLDFSLLLAKNYEVDIQLVYVQQEVKGEYESELEREQRSVSQKFDAIINDYSKKNPQIKIQGIIKQGKIHEEVVEQADAMDDSVIVTSTHGGSGFEELFVGSNAYKIVSSTTRPVFTLRGDNVPSQLERIILPIDATNETREKVPFTADLASKFDAEVHVVTVTSAEVEDIQRKIDQYAEQVRKYLIARDIKCVRDALYGPNITDITIEYANKVKADLIAIMSEQEKSIQNLLLGNYAHQMINKSKIPVLIISNKHIGIVTESFKTEGIYYEQ